MMLRDDQKFAIRNLFGDYGELGRGVIERVDKMESLDYEDTGVGFISTVRTSDGILKNFPVSSISKSFIVAGSGDFLAFDVFIVGADMFDLEGVAIVGNWPPSFSNITMEPD